MSHFMKCCDIYNISEMNIIALMIMDSVSTLLIDKKWWVTQEYIIFISNNNITNIDIKLFLEFMKLYLNIQQNMIVV